MPSKQREAEMSTTFADKLKIDVYPPERQGSGAFDGGRITEIKPIGFPGDGSAVPRVGPIFYWAWASSHEPAKIALHPHRAFEIMSYVLAGEIGHYDTLGTRSRVKRGGAQVMQTGSGVSHEEEMFSGDTQFFQIWFEPHLEQAVKRPPTYHEYQDEDFPRSTIENETDSGSENEKGGVTIKAIIGEGAPVALEVDAAMHDVTIEPGGRYRHALAAGRSLAVVTISGQGAWEASDRRVVFKAKDFTVIQAQKDATVFANADTQSPLRLAIIEVPTEVDYPLYSKE